jgi:hypothetical protein
MNDQIEGNASPRLAPRNRIAGAALVLIGIYVAIEGYNYGLGQVSRFGPGALPFGLGVLTVVFGALIALLNPDGEDKAQPLKLRPALLVLAALLAFALLIDTAGLVLATAALVFISGAADPEHTLRSLSATFVFLLGFVYVVFAQLLSIPFSLFGS